jgi:hypothetical protein
MMVLMLDTADGDPMGAADSSTGVKMGAVYLVV